MDVYDHNRKAWDNQVKNRSPWTIPVSSEEIEKARLGKFKIILTPKKPVPLEWLGTLENRDVLCLASGGGQQGPLLAAAGARVVVFDASDQQLEQDRKVAARDELPLLTVQGDMKDLSTFDDESFDLIIHPCSNCFIPNTLPVWKESYRVLKRGGELLSGFLNPVYYASDRDLQEEGTFKIEHTIPYSDAKSLPPEKLNALIKAGEPLEFGHSLDDLIGGQIAAGFQITGFFEDTWDIENLDKYLAQFIATRALKPSQT